MIDATTVLNFWFNESSPQQWYKKSDSFDQVIKDRFYQVYQQAICGELYDWRETSQGRLAEIIVLDQFSRNMFRNDSQAFQYDAVAVVLSQEAIHSGADQTFFEQPEKLAFMYMPLMHSESLLIHEQAVEVFSRTGLESNYEFELKHLAIIKRFGRYPHRNEVLGRKSTPEELAFLKQPGSGF